MAIEQLNFDLRTKDEEAIHILQEYEPPEGYYLAFSGGKDSVVIYDLAVRAGVKFDAHYCVSPIDPPEIYKFIKKHYPDVIWDYHARGFWKKVVINGLPLRTQRWCCKIIKEAGGVGRTIVTGIRRAEGNKRRNYSIFAPHRLRKNTFFVRPILEFDNYDIWAYIAEYNLSYCSLYDEGFKRIGCVLCPYNTQVEREISRFPRIANLWLLACQRINEKEEGKYFTTAQERFDWWIKR